MGFYSDLEHRYKRGRAGSNPERAGTLPGQVGSSGSFDRGRPSDASSGLHSTARPHLVQKPGTGFPGTEDV